MHLDVLKYITVMSYYQYSEVRALLLKKHVNLLKQGIHSLLH